jgi:hypothetical protein
MQQVSVSELNALELDHWRLNPVTAKIKQKLEERRQELLKLCQNTATSIPVDNQAIQINLIRCAELERTIELWFAIAPRK